MSSFSIEFLLSVAAIWSSSSTVPSLETVGCRDELSMFDVAVGITVGYFVGNTLGCSDGIAVGMGVGSRVGMNVGTVVGWAVG